MTDFSINRYREYVKAHYETVKNQDMSGALSEASPAILKRLCLEKFDTDLSRDDVQLLKRFFDINDEEKFCSQIKNADRDKLKPVSNFLRGKTEDPQIIVLEIVAILTDFQPRPYLKFKKKPDEGDIVYSDDIINKLPENQPEQTNANFISQKPVPIFDFKNPMFFIALFIAVLSVGFLLKQQFFPAEECMQWKDDHFEIVDCKGKVPEKVLVDPIYKYNPAHFSLKKIEVSDTTAFFKDGQPIIWYMKKNNKCEYFNQAGNDPVSGKPLLPVTFRIINNHVLNQKF